MLNQKFVINFYTYKVWYIRYFIVRAIYPLQDLLNEIISLVFIEIFFIISYKPKFKQIVAETINIEKNFDIFSHLKFFFLLLRSTVARVLNENHHIITVSEIDSL